MIVVQIADYDRVEEAAPSPLIDDTSAGQTYVGDHKRERRSLTEKTYIDDSIEDETSVLGEFLRDDDQTYYPDHSSGHDKRHVNFQLY